MLKIEKVKKKDFYSLKKLFERNKLIFLSKTNWKILWLNPHLRINKSWNIGFVLKNQKKIVGYIGNTPRSYYFKRKNFICSNINSWVVDRKFRYSSILLLKELLNNKKKNFYLSTTTGPEAAYVFRKLNIKEIKGVSLEKAHIVLFNFKKALKTYLNKKNLLLKLLINLFMPLIIFFLKKEFVYDKYFSSNFDSNIKVITKFDSKHDIFWSKFLEENKEKFVLDRSSKWLNWQLKSLIKEQKILILGFKKNDTLLGYCITTIIKNKNYKFGKLLDLVVLKNNESVYKDLIAKSIEIAKAKNCDFFEMRYLENKDLDNMKFLKLFRHNVPHNSFYFKSNQIMINNIVKKNEKWKITNLDGDTLSSFKY